MKFASMVVEKVVPTVQVMEAGKVEKLPSFCLSPFPEPYSSTTSRFDSAVL